MNPCYPLTIYYDASCPLCAEEVRQLKQHDQHGRLLLVDCSAADFQPPLGAPAQAQMLQQLHVRTAEGHWVAGVPSFQLVYSAVGFDFVGEWMQRPGVARLLQCIYPMIARLRHWIPGWFSVVWVNWLARRAHRRSRICANGQCNL